ncbi:hypothetical protein C8034_v011948 [Colletotrichum sidae]|uniref:Uncharacterized protein n=1 Tax=Colletotrichum sidae TaxID=1347389 RepID=A0A4R8TKD6_9PEZI|nr:hypothetical protein C8034_v011948 [Colletotrichum sidae]
MSSMESLPTELIHRIASYCDVQDIHAQAPEPSSTLINDTHAFVSIVNDAIQASHPTQPGSANPRGHPDLLDDLMLWFRAVCTQIDNQFRRDYPSARVLEQNACSYPKSINLDVAAAAPAFLIAILEARNWSSFHASNGTGVDLPLRQQAFCLAVGALENQALKNMHQLTLWLTNSTSYSKSGQVNFKITGALAHLLRSSLPGRQPSAYLPSPERLPFALQRNVVPLPSAELPGRVKRRICAFESTVSWDKWNREYVRGLARDMQSGEWQGYFTRSLARHSTGPWLSIEKGPLENINFKLVFELTADDCKEPAGTFNFTGKYHERSQSVVLKKVGPGGHSYKFNGWFTPLGIAGTLQLSSWPHGAAGWFWIWKREWVNGQQLFGADQ